MLVLRKMTGFLSVLMIFVSLGLGIALVQQEIPLWPGGAAVVIFPSGAYVA